MSYNEGKRSFTASGAITAHGRVKITSGSTTTPIEVELAGAGEQHIGVALVAIADGEVGTIQLRGKGGSVEMEAAGAITKGAAIYGAASGTVDDTVSGSAIGYALDAATASGDIIECVEDAILSTTAASVSVADSGSLITATTVEAAFAEAFTHIQSAQKFIDVPLVNLWEGDATNIVTILGPATTPIIDMANGDTDSGIVITWAASENDPILFQTALPPDIDVSADVVIHFRGKMGGSTDTPTLAADSYFNEGDTKVEDASSAMGAAYAENTITIAAADVPAGAQTLTVELTPGAHTTDTFIISGVWIEYTGTTLTS